MERGLHRYEKAAEAAELYSVKLALENSVFPEYVHYLFSNIQSPAVGFCYDSGHENAFTPGENYLDLYSARLIAMHLHDNDGAKDLHSMPLHGTIDWSAKMRQLRRCPYADTMLTLECSLVGNTAEEGFRTALDTAKKLLLL